MKNAFQKAFFLCVYPTLLESEIIITYFGRFKNELEEYLDDAKGNCQVQGTRFCGTLDDDHTGRSRAMAA